MKKMITRLLTVALLGMSFAMTACTGDTTTTTAAALDNSIGQDLERQGTLQGKIMDGVTGAAIGGDVKVYLIQGTANRTPNKLETAGDLQGEYAFTNIPLDTTLPQTNDIGGAQTAGSANFKIVVIKPGYQRFEGEISPSQFASVGAVLGNGAAGAAAGSIMFDKVYNKIGNIYLYPTGATAKDYTVKVRYNGAAVAGATVELQQNAVNNQQTSEPNNNVIAMSPGYLQTLSGTTDASGNVVFKGSDLVLGGAYFPVVLPVTTTATALTSTASYAGQQADVLEEAGGTPFIVGANITATQNGVTSTGAVVLGTEQTILMVGANNNDSSLYVTKISNSTAGILVDSGALTITFNRPVQINNNNRPVYSTTVNTFTGVAPTAGATDITVTNTVYGFGATIGSTANSMTAILTQFGSTSATKPVVATLDATNTVLTLTPSFATAKGAADYDLSIQYFDAPQNANLPVVVPTVAAGVTTRINYIPGVAAAQPSVSPLGKPELQYNLFSVAGAGRQVLRNGNVLGTNVRMTAPAAGL